MSNGQYKAPALKRGLAILQLLAAEHKPMKITTISEHLNLSTNEIFRIIKVLEDEHYIANTHGNKGYVITNKLFLVGAIRPRTQSLVEIALPFMNQLSTTTEQSCHISIHSRGQIVVIIRVEAACELSFSGPTGYRASLHETASGMVLFAFQSKVNQADWTKVLSQTISDRDISVFHAKAQKVKREGMAISESRHIKGVTDIATPIMSGGQAVACLCIPFVERKKMRRDMDYVIKTLNDTAARISDSIIDIEKIHVMSD